jgi:hypothetical protein
LGGHPLKLGVEGGLLALGIGRALHHQPALLPCHRLAAVGRAGHGAGDHKALAHRAGLIGVIQRGRQHNGLGRDRWLRHPAAQQRGHRSGHGHGKEVAARTSGHGGARLQRGGFAIGDEQAARVTEQRDQFPPCGQVTGVIGVVAGQGRAEQRHAAGVERGEGLLALEQIGTLVFAVAKLEQRPFRLAIGRRGVGDVEAGRIDAGDRGRQGIGAHEVATQGLLQHGHLGRALADHPKQMPEAVIGHIFAADRPAGHGCQGRVMGQHPGLQRGEPMVAFVDQKDEEEHRELAVAQACPHAVRGPVGIDLIGNLHALHPGEQEGNGINTGNLHLRHREPPGVADDPAVVPHARQSCLHDENDGNRSSLKMPNRRFTSER